MLQPDPNFHFPAWLEAELPEVGELSVVSPCEGGFVIEDPDGGRSDVYPTLAAAYDGFDRAVLGRNIVFSDDCVAAEEGAEELLGGVVLPNGRFLIVFTDADELALLQEAYRSWQDVYEEWRQDPKDFVKAFYFLEQHPAFWVRATEERTFSWHTAAGAPREVCPWRDDQGNVGVSMELGAHVAPEYTTHYHDIRLDVTAGSYEEAVVELATRVDLFFDKDGVEREGVPFEEPEWMIEVRRRLEGCLLREEGE